MPTGQIRKIAITGANGFLASTLSAHFSASDFFKVIPLDHGDLDITRQAEAKKVLAEISPDILINCAVVVNVDRCQAEPQLAYAVNRDGVRTLLEAAAGLPKPPAFVQISSSEVFGNVEEGEYKIEGYFEDDEPHPVSVYQKSKKEAEDLIREFVAAETRLTKWFIARAGHLYGEAKRRYIEEFADMVRRGKEILLIRDQWRSPTWTRDFNRGLETLIASDYPNGTYHIVNEVKPGEATPLDVIEEIRTYFGIPKETLNIKFISRKDFFKVPRAPSNVLKNSKLPFLPYWRDSLREYLTLSYPPNSETAAI